MTLHLTRPTQGRLGRRLRLRRRLHGHRPGRPDPARARRGSRRHAEPGRRCCSRATSRSPASRCSSPAGSSQPASARARRCSPGSRSSSSFSALAGRVGHRSSEIVGFRAGWGLGNALFIATALCGDRRLGHAAAWRRDHPLRGRARARHRLRPAARRPARRHLLARAVLRHRGADGDRLRRDPRAARGRSPKPARQVSLAEPLRALAPPRPADRRRSSRSSTTSASSRCWPTRRSRWRWARTQLGLVFFGWGLLLALTSVFVAPRLKRRFGAGADARRDVRSRWSPSILVR